MAKTINPIKNMETIEQIKVNVNNLIQKDKCIHNNTEWFERVKGLWWCSCNNMSNIDFFIHNQRTQKPMSYYERLYALRDKLLSYGGQEACLDLYEPDLDKIINRSIFLYGKGARLRKGKSSQCHANSCKLYEINHEKYPELKIMTGYALSEDGMWRQHSWLVQVFARSYKVIETTVRRIAYVGFIMDDEEALKFCADNY